MSRDPDTAFRRKMSEYGLDPGPIIWDRRVHHLPGKGKAEKNPKNKSAWYVGFEDRTGGMFGDFSQGLEEVNWQMKRDRPPTPAEKEEWARQDRERAKRQAEARAKATAEVQAAWNAAVPANTANIHPYLEAKHIDRGVDKIRVLKAGIEGLTIMGEEYRIKEDMLLIPMRKEHDQLVQRPDLLGKRLEAVLARGRGRRSFLRRRTRRRDEQPGLPVRRLGHRLVDLQVRGCPLHRHVHPGRALGRGEVASLEVRE